MTRSRDQNIALAVTASGLFRTLIHQLEANKAVVDSVLTEYEDAIFGLDRDRLWTYYLRERKARNNAAMAGDIRAYYTHGFLARACITPASALTGRAASFLREYLRDGIRFAGKLLRDPAFEFRWVDAINSLKEP